MIKDRKNAKKNRKYFYVIIFICIVCVILAVFYIYSANSFGKTRFVKPLATSDPASDIQTSLKNHNISYLSNPVASDSALLVRINEETLVLFTTNKDPQLQVNTLQIILNKLTIEGKRARQIDLRFSDPVVLY